jgi:hypothetical protein
MPSGERGLPKRENKCMGDYLCGLYLASIGRVGGRTNPMLAYVVAELNRNRNLNVAYMSNRVDFVEKILNDNYPHLVVTKIEMGVKIMFPRCEL